MTARKSLIVAAAVSLASVPAWAVSSQASSSHGLSTAPGQLKDADEHSSTHGNSGTHGKSGSSHKCKPHGVAFVLTGVLGPLEALTPNPDGTYSGKVTLKEVTHTNHHAKGTKAPYTETLTNVHVTFGLADTNADGSVGVDDLKEGDRVKLIGKITRVGKKCGTFNGTITIRKVVFSAPTA
jgi:hypothetical protein